MGDVIVVHKNGSLQETIPQELRRDNRLERNSLGADQL